MARVTKPVRSSVVVAVLLLVSGLGGLGLASPAFASGGVHLYAYADGTGTTPGCPQGDASGSGCSLASALSQAAAGDMVLLATAGSTAHFVGNWTLSTSGTSASDPVGIAPAPGVSDPTLDGDGTAGAKGSILDITAGASVTISGVTFTGGDDELLGGSGGAIDTGDGTAGGTVTVIDSTFSNNTTANGGGYSGGAIDNGDNGGSGTLIVSDSTFSGNSADYDGGAINNGDKGSGTLIVAGSTFVGNTANYDGAAIDNADNSGAGTLIVSDSTFSGNSASHDASIDSGDSGPSSSAQVFLAGDLFAGGCDQASGTWTDEGFNVDPDGSCESNGPSDIESSKVFDLGSLQVNGGQTMTVAPMASNPAIRRIPPNTTVTMNGSDVHLCPTEDQRGVVSVPDRPCSAGAASGGELFAYADGTDDAGLSGCEPVVTTSQGCSLAGALATAIPGDTVFLGTSGMSQHYDGNWTLSTVGTGKRAPVTIEPAPMVVRPTLDGEGSGGPRGSILTLTNPVSVTIKGVTFTHADTFSNVNGGAIDNGLMAAGGTVTVEDSTFTHNTAQDGGAIDNGDFDGSGTLTVVNSTFTGNHGLSGGAISNGLDGGSGTATVTGSTFTHNKADYGGAIDTGDWTGTGTLSVADSTFTGNTANDGGAIDNADHGGSGTLVASATTISANHASDGNVIHTGGGGGTGSVFVTADLFNGSCAQTAGTWNDKGFNAGTDTTCLGGPRRSSDRVSTAVSRLGHVRSYGGPTATLPLAWSNPALRLIPASTKVTLGGVSVALCPRTDQRGVRSAPGTRCDAGAMQSAADRLTGSGHPAMATVGKPVTLSARITRDKGLPATVPAPTGAVRFTLGKKRLCQATAVTAHSNARKVTGSCATRKLPKGSDHITATYLSTDGYATATRRFTVHTR